jgi:hypothetical protein
MVTILTQARVVPSGFWRDINMIALHPGTSFNAHDLSISMAYLQGILSSPGALLYSGG